MYKVPRFDNEVPTNKFPLINQGGNEFFDNDYYSGVAATGVINETKTSRGFNGEITTYISDKLAIFVKPPGLPDFRLTNVSPLLSSANLSLSGYAPGDSGGPLFIPYNDELILLGIIQTRGGSGGTAKNFGNSDIQELISQGMEAVGNTWGYQLSTVRLS